MSQTEMNNSIAKSSKEITAWLISETKKQVFKKYAVTIGDEFCLTIIEEIVTNNFPSCLGKALDSPQSKVTETVINWRLNNGNSK